MFVDTHAHLDFPEFGDDLPQIIERARAAGVEKIVSIGTSIQSSRKTLEIAAKFDEVFVSVGLHPSEVSDNSLCDLRELEQLACEKKVVAIGETGLDYRHGDATKRRQKDLFFAQLELARKLNLPVVIHNRDADADCLEILRAHGGTRGVMHCFGGDEIFAKNCMEIGLLVSFTGILTFKNARKLREVAAKIPLESVMLETDCPYLAPEPHRGKRNEPAFVPEIARVLATLHNVSVERVAEVTTVTARRLFRLL
jgi:TatD DNase family protein